MCVINNPYLDRHVPYLEATLPTRMRLSLAKLLLHL